ncbi:MAG: Wadjet anti-phage system protein JetD domain-containing protein [Verrucomicrobiales bacterium]
MQIPRVPIAIELFKQWRNAGRGRMDAARSRAFSRKWNDLLDDAELLSAQEQNEAASDVRALQELGLLEIKSVPYKAHLIERVSIPLAAEARWMQSFGFTPDGEGEWRQIQEFPWQPELSFLKEARLNLSFAELQQLNTFYANGGRELPLLPIKERSLQIFGDEKRLDLLYGSSSLFGPGRLTLAQLCCFLVPEPLGWKRGARAEGEVIILENVATWHTYCRWDAQQPQFSGVVYGGGQRIIHSVEFLKDIFAELGGRRPILYFGDLDGAGLRIARTASERALGLHLPQIKPHQWSYAQLLKLAESQNITQPTEPQNLNEADVRWLGDLELAAKTILQGNKRIPQEWLTVEYLKLAMLSDANGG